MLKTNKMKIKLSGSTFRWYKDKGYDIPTHVVQLWATVNGKKIKNGISERIKNGTEIEVLIDDLPPKSNVNVQLICPRCNKDYKTTFGAYKLKESNLCSTCVKKKIIGDGSHSYWVKTLIIENDNARCDISSESDKRFLVLHHLDSRSNGGRNIKENYVILSANYHMAFHNWNGGTNISCKKEDYIKFKEEEMKKTSNKTVISQTDILADDWGIVTLGDNK